MTFSTLTDQVRQSTQHSPRQGADIDMFIFHGQASTNDDVTISMMVNRTRQVSANYTISNEGRITGVVPEEFRAWTSGSSTDGGKGAAMDRRAITVEIENQTGAPGWTFSAAAQEACARLLADVSKRYGIPLDRDHCVGHRELYTRWGASYATACPQALDMGWIVNRAKQLRTAPAAEDIKEIIMATVNEIWGEKLGGSAGVDAEDKTDIEAWRGLSRTYRRVTETWALLRELAPLIRKIANSGVQQTVTIKIDDATAELIASKVAAKVSIPTEGRITLS